MNSYSLLFCFFGGTLISALLLLFLIKDKVVALKLKLKNFKHPLITIICEGLLFLVCIISSLYFIDSVLYLNSLNVISLIISYISGVSFVIFIIILLSLNWGKIELLFLILMIPFGLLYMFTLFPDFVPDETAHFMKAFLTSTFNFSSTNEGFTYGDYVSQKITDIHMLLNEFYIEPNIELNVPFVEACSYNFVGYLVPAIALLIGRLLHFSIYLSYYFARMANFVLFLYFGYKAIQITPKCKWIFLVLYFNPMMIQQGMSISVDVFVNSLCIFAIAYFLKLYFAESLNNKDIVIVFSLISGILVVKYAYLPIFGCYLILLPKIFKMNKINWIVFGLGAVVAVLLFYLSLSAGSGSTNIPAQKAYIETAGVNVKEQLSLLLHYPGRVFLVLFETMKVRFENYLQTFCGRLGWLNIYINYFSFLLYYILMFFVIFIDNARLKIADRAWLFFISGVSVAIIIIGMYLTWTGVGAIVADGVQGRYFIPIAFLLLISISNSLFSKIKHSDIIVIASIIVINFPVLFDIIKFYN